MEWSICWLIGHYPVGPIQEYVINEGKIYIYSCKRCKKSIVFDEEKGWLMWKNNGNK